MTYEEALKMLTVLKPIPIDGFKIIAEAYDLAIKALEKQEPKKPRETRCALMCANCGHKITEIGCKKLTDFTVKNADRQLIGVMANE